MTGPVLLSGFPLVWAVAASAGQAGHAGHAHQECLTRCIRALLHQELDQAWLVAPCGQQQQRPAVPGLHVHAQ